LVDKKTVKEVLLNPKNHQCKNYYSF